ncbi:MAG: glycosyltransferase family 2 protein [Planctomycetota bacterium]
MIDVLIITHNEAANLPHCLRSLEGWTHKVFVVDSGSTDGTADLARELNAEVVHHDWPGYARQRNWALDHLPLTQPWTLILDADELVPPGLRDALLAVAERDPRAVAENGFFVNRLTYFLDRPIRHCGYFPSWNLRFFKRDAGRYEDRHVHEHVVIDNPVGFISEPILHQDRRGLEHFYAKHNRYSTLEAREIFREIHGLRDDDGAANLTSDARWRRWLKRNVTRVVPFPGLWRFLYMYFLRFGFLDGWAGYRFCLLIASYDAMVAFKLKIILKGLANHTDSKENQAAGSQTSLAVAEGSIGPAFLSREQPRSDRVSSRSVDLPEISPPAESTPAPETIENSRRIPATVVILAHNEARQISACIRSASMFGQVLVVDSGSTDDTPEKARKEGAVVLKRPFDNFGSQRNFAVDSPEANYKWQLHLDADERMTPRLASEIMETLETKADHAGFFIASKLMLGDRWLKHAGDYPTYQMRLIHRDRCRFQAIGHGQRELATGPTQKLREPYLHYAFSKGLEAWFVKHVGYAKLEAEQALTPFDGSKLDVFSGDRVKARRMIKFISWRLPFRPFGRYFYQAFVKRGFMDGRAGFTFALMMATYEAMSLTFLKWSRSVSRSAHLNGGGPDDTSTRQDPTL